MSLSLFYLVSIYVLGLKAVNKSAMWLKQTIVTWKNLESWFMCSIMHNTLKEVDDHIMQKYDFKKRIGKGVRPH